MTAIKTVAMKVAQHLIHCCFQCRITYVSLLSLALISISGYWLPTVAQQLKDASWGRWFSNCKIDRMTDKKECGVYILDRLHTKQKGGLVFLVSVNTIGSLGYVVSVGSRRPLRDCQMRIDAKQKVDSNVIESGACFFTHDAAKDLISQFKRGKNLILRLTPYAGV